MTPLDRARTALQATLDRLTVSRLGKSMYRETDADILALRSARDGLAVLIEEVERLTALSSTTSCSHEPNTTHDPATGEHACDHCGADLAPAPANDGKWSVRDTLTGAVYRQPNRMIAEKVAEWHGHSEVLPGWPEVAA